MNQVTSGAGWLSIGGSVKTAALPDFTLTILSVRSSNTPISGQDGITVLLSSRLVHSPRRNAYARTLLVIIRASCPGPVMYRRERGRIEFRSVALKLASPSFNLQLHRRNRIFFDFEIARFFVSICHDFLRFTFCFIFVIEMEMKSVQ